MTSRVGDVVVAGPSRVVLAALVLERPGGVVRERLADIVWPDGLPRTWASALRTHVSRVRSVLAAAVPAGGRDGGRRGRAATSSCCRRASTSRVDVDEAESALAAARDALASGDAGRAPGRGGCRRSPCCRPRSCPATPATWVDDVRSRLDEALVAALEVAGGAATGRGRRRGRAGGGRRGRRTGRRCGRARTAARMAALAAAGNRAEALRAYQRLRRVLADELGVDPSPETEAAYLALLGPAPPPRSGGRRRRADGDGRGAAAGAGAVRRPGRRAGRAGAAWEQAVGGARHVVVVTGEAGIGKTRLTTEAARRVAAGGRAGPVRPVRPGGDRPVPADRRGARRVGGGHAGRRAAARSATTALAELAAVLPSLAGPRRAAGGDGRARLFAAVTDLVAAAAKERPLLLVLDDLQWADDDTLLLVRHLLRRAGDAPVLVVAITRDHDLEPGHTLGEVVHSLDRDGWVRRLPLAGLDESEVRELVGRLAGGDDACRCRPPPAA